MRNRAVGLMEVLKMVRKAGSWSLLLMVALCGTAGAELIAYWPLNEGQGTKTADVTGKGNDGTLSSGVEWVAGVKGGAARFDTAGERIVTTGLNPTATNNAMTLAAWIKWEGRGGSISQQGIVGKRLGWNPGSIKWFWQTNPAGDLLFRCDTGAGGTGLWWGNTRLVPYANEWTHVAVTWANGTAVQYVNGKETDRGSVTLGDATTNATPVTIGCVDSTNTETFMGSIDEVRIYDTALPVSGITQAMTGDTRSASATQPSAGATDVPRDVVLSWAAGDAAAGHNVYFGTTFAEVDTADTTKPQSVSKGQTGLTYKVPAPLEYGQTYYWRVDEVNAPPSTAVAKGGVWSFTVEPYAYSIMGVTATASSSQTGMGPANTVNGSGMTGDLHGAEPTTMWLSGAGLPSWIQYDLGQVYKVYEMQVWNSNQLIEGFLGFGARKVTVETSLDGATWTPASDVPEFARAPGAPGYAANTTVKLGMNARYVRLTISSTWGGLAPQAGLSEVRFSYVPVLARAPQPAHNAGSVSLSPTLDWRPGREATSHKVFFGADRAAVLGGTVAAKTVADHGFDPGVLNFGTSYYWKVDEVGAATYPGSVWAFATQQHQPIDDFESYTDKAGAEIFTTWVDGFADNFKSSGSTVGLDQARNGTFGETTIFRGGKQSMPLRYDNTKAPNFSEAERTFTPTQDWTASGAQELVVYFRGVAPGFVETASGSILMNAIGTDIWNNGDQFRFAYKSLSGDGTMVARVDSIFNSNVWAKGGVMIRQSIQPGSVHAFMPITPGGASAGNGASFQRRTAANGAPANTDNTAAVVAAPYWVKIERKGNALSGSISPDGKTWTQLGAAETITMNNPVLIGLALCSHDAAITTSATFSNVSTTGNVTGAWQVAEIGAAQPAGNSVEGVYLSVKDSAGKTKVVQHPDTAATAAMSWQQWIIPLSEFTSAGVKMSAVKSLAVGVGNKAAPKAGGTGTMYVDDILFGGRPAPVGLVASYAFENDLKDSSANGYDGTAVGAPTFAPGKTGSALKLNGTTDCVDLGNWPGFNFPGSFSLSVWANIGAWTSNWNHVMVGNRGESGIGWQLRRRDSSRVVFTTRGVGQDDEPRSSKDAPLNEWVHIAAVYDNAANTKTLYINGVQDAFVATTPGKLAATTHNTYLGARANSANTGVEGRFTGMLDEVKIYDIALPPAEVLKLAGK